MISVLCTYSLKAVRKGIEDSAAAAVTNLGDASRDIPGKADVSRSSIAKGEGIEENRIVADIATGKINGNEFIIQGITQDNKTN